MLLWLWFPWPGSDAGIPPRADRRVKSVLISHSLAWWQWQGQGACFIESKKGSLWLLHYSTSFSKEKMNRKEAFIKDSVNPYVGAHPWGARGKSRDRELHNSCLIFSHLSPALSPVPSSCCPDIALSLRSAAPNASDPQILKPHKYNGWNTKTWQVQ